MTRNLIFIIGWPLLIIASIYIFVKARHVYRLIKGSMVGRITQVLVYNILVNICSLGTVCTVYVFIQPKGIYLVLGVFVVWFIIFVWSLKTLTKIEKEAKQIVGQDKVSK